jgi:hypothetical protein
LRFFDYRITTLHTRAYGIKNFLKKVDKGTSGCSPVVHILRVYIGYFVGAMSLCHSFCLGKFCSPLCSFFWFVPGFVEVDHTLD